MSRSLFLVAALVALTGAAATPAARAEKSAPIDEIPLCPGAVPAPNDDSISVPLLGFTLDQERRYLVKAAPETVVRFYQKKLSAREVPAEQFEDAVGQAENGELEGARMTLAWHAFKAPGLAPPISSIWESSSRRTREPIRRP